MMSEKHFAENILPSPENAADTYGRHSSDESAVTLAGLPRVTASGTSTPPLSSDTGSASSCTLVGDLKVSAQLSTFNLFLAHIGAAMTLFLATTDATIVSTALPTISAQFRASELEYTWVGVAYGLTQTAFQPLYGKLSDMVGRKVVLFTSMGIFMVGSVLCGSAQTMLWLILARALSGIGGGGIVSLVWTITSEIVDDQSRAKWSQALSLTWSCSALAGPLLGGLFSGKSGLGSWRWAFFLNVPVCIAAFIVLWMSLRHVNLGSSSELSWCHFKRRFDFVGLLLFVGGSSCIVIGFSLAANFGWSSAPTLSLIVCGLAVLAAGGIYELQTKRDPLFPPSAFRNVTVVIILVVNFLHNFAFNAGTFYLASYFQWVQGYTPLDAGLNMLPYSLGSSLASMPVAWFIGYWQRRSMDTSGQKMMISAGLAIAAIGFGLMILLDENSTRVLNSMYPLVAGIGVGMLFHAPFQVFVRALQGKDMASGTSAFFLVRFTGATVGLSVAGAVFHSRLLLAVPPALRSSFDVDHLSYLSSHSLEPPVLHAVSLSIQTIWMVCCPCLGVACLISIFLRNLSFPQIKIPNHQEKFAGPVVVREQTPSVDSKV